MILIIKYYWRT